MSRITTNTIIFYQTFRTKSRSKAPPFFGEAQVFEQLIHFLSFSTLHSSNSDMKRSHKTLQRHTKHRRTHSERTNTTSEFLTHEKRSLELV